MTATYNAWLVALSVVIAAFASYTALDLAARISASRRSATAYWLVGGALSMGLGIWAMHFIGMLALGLPIPLAYDLPITLLSIAPAVVAAALALYIVNRGQRTPLTLGVSALLMGSGISIMHYAGMAALRMSPPIRYDPGLLALSVMVAVAASLAALQLAFRAARTTSATQKLGGASVMGAAIAGMHYIGMAAAHFAPDSVCLAGPGQIEPGWLAVNVGGGTILILGFTVLASAFDSALAAQTAHALDVQRRTSADTERKAAELAETMTRELRAAHERLDKIIQSSPVAMYTRTRDGIVTSWNPAAEKTFGWSASEAIGKPLLTVPEDLQAESVAIRDRTLGGQDLVAVETRRRRRDGTLIDVRSNLAPLRNADGAIDGYVTVIADVTEQKKYEVNLRLSAQVFENAAEGIMVTDARANIVAVNRAFTTITGYSAVEAIGKTPRMLHSGWQSAGTYESMWDNLTRTGTWQGELLDRRKNGATYVQWTNISAVRDDNGRITHYVAVMSDITERKEAEQRLSHLATHDALTGLANRTLFRERLGHALLRARRDGTLIAVFFLDLDNFKLLNDSLGHHAGDQLLREVSARLTGCVRETDTVARQGGDEFTILLEDVSDPGQIRLVAQKLQDALSPALVLSGQEFFVTASVGIDISATGNESADDLLKNADAAMYHAKEQGRNNIQFYSAALNEGMRQRLTIERGLHRALDRQEFVLHYQPKFDLRSRQIIGAEALLRWEHPVHGRISPAEFIPIAEASGLIVPIGEWVLRQACTQSKAWQDMGLHAVPIAVNISTRQFQPSFVNVVRKTLHDCHLDAHYIELEITESVFMKNVEAVTAVLEQVSALGVQFSIDDFGTGYSSMSYLKRFPVDRLKIEASFVRDIASDPDDAAIVKAIISLGHSLGLKVIAEGVESASQLAFLLAEGCDEAQGQYFSHPVPAEEFAMILRAPERFAASVFGADLFTALR